MLRARIDRGVNLRPWTVTSGWSAGGGLAVCAQPKLTPGPKTAAAMINMTSITRAILSFMVTSTMLNQDVHCTPYILELIFAGRPYPDTSSRNVALGNGPRKPAGQ